MEEIDPTSGHKTCGLCRACTISNDCTKCDNCIRNYIDVNIKQGKNYTLRRCLNRICRDSSPDNGIQSGLKFDALGQTDKNSEISQPNISNLHDVNNSLSHLELTEFKTGKPKTCRKWLVTQAKTDGEETNIDSSVLDESSDESDKMNNNFENCGDCSGCAAPDCGFCWPCIESDAQLSSRDPCTGKTCRLQSKIKAAFSIDKEREIETEKQESKMRKKRMRCGTCPGCKTTQNCGVCTVCIRKSKDKFYPIICNIRKCHVLSSEKSQRCGQCENCQRLPCEDCGHCKAGKPHFCRAKRCNNPIWVKITKRIPKTKNKGVKFVKQMASENEMDRKEKSFGDTQSKILRKQEQNGNKVTEDTEAHKDKPRKRMRCGSCPGCKTTQNCGVCTVCVGKRENKPTYYNSTCSVRKCHVLKSEKSQRCGQCESCQRLPCEDCGHCKAGKAYFCRAKRCKNPTWVKITKRIRKNKKSKSVEFIQQVSSENEMDNGKEESFGDANSKILSRKEGEQNGNKVTEDIEAHKNKPRKRIRCGSCPGCKTMQNCGVCNACIKKRENKFNNSTCNVRKCHVLSNEKSQRCGQCESCQRLPCEDCGQCKAGHVNFCRAKRCKNPTWVKIKKKIPKSKESNKVEFIKQLSSENEMNNEEEKENGNKESPDVKSYKDYKHIKRTIRCKNCDGCNAEDCGNCQSCKMNQQFGEKIILGKLTCLTNTCKFPVDLNLNLKSKSKLLLLKEQDDAPEGAACPVKVVQGRLYDGRCYFCKKLPRVGKPAMSELLRHYAVSHFSKELKDEFAGVTFCKQCNLQIKDEAVNFFAIHHFGQKHEEVVKYLPKEAAILIPEKQRQYNTERQLHQRSIVRRKVKKKVKWPEVPEGFDAGADTRDWKGESDDDLSIREENVEVEIVNGWTIEHVIDEMDEPLPSLNDPDFTGVGGICNVCQTEYSEVTAVAMHLHEDHHIQGGSSYIMRDCDKFIKSGFIKLVPQENGKSGNANSEIVVKHTNKAAESSEVFTPSRNSDGWMNFNSKRSVARKSTSQKSRSSKTVMKEQISHSSSSGDEETSAHADELEMEHEIDLFKKEMELLPATTRDKDAENSKPFSNSDGNLDPQSKRNVAWKSTSRKSRSSHTSGASSFKLDSMRRCADSKSVFEDDSDSCSSCSSLMN